MENENIKVEQISKREHFAAMAMQGLCANPAAIPDDKIAPLSLMFADKLIAALAAPPEGKDRG